MKLLLDTHILLWYSCGILPPKANILINDRKNTLFFSSASIWEVVIKFNLGQPDFQIDPQKLYEGLLGDDCQEIAITARHTLEVGTLPSLHKDPFDRILLAQALIENMNLVTSDSILAQYPKSVLYVG